MPPHSDPIAALREPRGLARALSLVTDTSAPGAEKEVLLRAAYAAGGRARRIGITGAPGAGKSTLADALAHVYRAAGETVAIVAVDPSSPLTGGALLGDRIRMGRHHADTGVFIRSFATRGTLGGLAPQIADAVAVCDAAGRDRILVETVGVGQAEVDVAQLVDVTLVVLVPSMGDDIQTLKAGLIEVADIFVINKADLGADVLEQHLTSTLSLRPESAGAWRPPIVRTVAHRGQGVSELAQAIAARLDWIAAHEGLSARRARQWRPRLLELARTRLAARLLDPVLTPARLDEMANAVAAGDDPLAAVDAVIGEALALDRAL